MAGQKIRIKLAAYDHKMVDQATERIVDTIDITQKQTFFPAILHSTYKL